MNLGSWVVLAIVAAIVALAIRATFFKKGGHGCCGGSHEPAEAKSPENVDLDIKFSCSDCGSCQGCAAKANCLQPTIKPLG